MTRKNKNPNQYSFSGDGGVPDEPWNPGRRNKALKTACYEYTRAGKRKGAVRITEFNPKFNELDEKYDIYRLRDKYNRFIDMGDEAVFRACAACAIRGCELRNDPESWREKYPKSPQRNKLLAKLSKNSTEQC